MKMSPISPMPALQMLLKSVRSEGICLKAVWVFQSTEVLVRLLCLKAELKHLHFVFSFSIFPSLGSCTAFKTELWKIFKHLIWHQGKSSSVDGKETVRKKNTFFFFLDWKYHKSLALVRCTVIQHVFCCEMTSVGWGVRMEFQLIPWNYADYLRCQMYMCQGAFESSLLVRSFFKSGCLGPFSSAKTGYKPFPLEDDYQF